jgi:uncharacterized repeat protein (TIGR01451 family)
MPIRRTLLSAFILASFGASVYGLQTTEDSFIQWDAPALKAAAKKPKSSVTYFAPSKKDAADDSKATASEVVPAEVAVVPMREVKSTATEPSPTTRPPAIDATPATTGNPSKASGSPQRSTDKPVQSAAFVEDGGTKSAAKVVQVSGQSDDGNPFEEFLQQDQQTRTVRPMTPGRAAVEAPDTEEQAEVLVPGKRTAAASRNVHPMPAEESAPPARAAIARTKPVAPAPSTVKPVSFATSNVQASQEEVGPQSPGITVQWVRHGDLNVGQECSVDLVVSNTSKSVVRSVMTEAVIPEGVEVASADPVAMAGAETPTWTFGELKPGESRTVALKLVPTHRGEVRLDAFVRLTGSSSTSFSVQEPMIEVAVSGPEMAEIGEQVAYVVRVSNPGTGIATNVVVQASVPEGLEHRDGALPSIEIGTLSPGESRQAKLNLTAIAGGEHELAVRAVAEGGLNMESFAAVSIAEPELAVAIDGPTEQMAGRADEYTLTISNNGNVQTSNVRTKYRLPDGLEFVSANRGGKYSKPEHSIEWFVGTLKPDETSEFKLTLKANETGDMVHKAGVRTEHGQTWICDHLTTVEGTAALDLQIAADDQDVRVGEVVTWTVTLRNTGARAATNVGMSCELPSGIQLVDADGPSDNIAENGIMVFRSLPSIAAGDAAVYTIVGNCLREGNHRLRLRIASESITEPLIGEEFTTVSAE